MIKDTELLTIAEAAERCRISEPKLREYIRLKKLRVVKLPGKRLTRITLSELQRFWSTLEKQPIGASPEVIK